MNFERLGIPKIHFGQGPRMTTSISREQELSLPFQEAFLGFRYLGWQLQQIPLDKYFFKRIWNLRVNRIREFKSSIGEIFFNSHFGFIHWNQTQQPAALAVLGSYEVNTVWVLLSHSKTQWLEVSLPQSSSFSQEQAGRWVMYDFISWVINEWRGLQSSSTCQYAFF